MGARPLTLCIRSLMLHAARRYKHQWRRSKLLYGIPDAPTPDFLAPHGTVAVNVPRRDIASSRERLSQSTQVAQRPSLGEQVGTRWRSERLPRLPYSPWDVTLSVGACCLAVPLFCCLFLSRRGQFSWDVYVINRWLLFWRCPVFVICFVVSPSRTVPLNSL